MQLVQHAHDLWTIAQPFRVGGFLEIGLHTTVIRLKSGELALHSPASLSESDVSKIATLGEVSLILGPNLMHHLFIGAAQKHFPKARLVAPARLATKRADLKIDVPVAASDMAAVQSGLTDVAQNLVPLPVEGMPGLDEIAWVHTPSRTLILSDLAFNLRPPAPFATRAFMALNGGFDRFGPTRIARRMIHDSKKTRSSLDRILEQDFSRVIVGHGEVFEGDGRAALREGYSFLT